MKDSITQANFNTVFPVQAELERDTKELINKYADKLSIGEIFGVIDVTKISFIVDCKFEE